MKPLFIFGLIASLALNITFAIWFVAPTERAAPPREFGVVETDVKSPSEAMDGSIWPALRTEDLHDLAHRLRTAGFSASMTRAIVGYHVSESFAARRKNVEGQDRPFWQNMEPDPRSRAGLAELDREEAVRLREILGDDDDDVHALMILDRGWHFGFLPAEKAAQVMALHREFDRRWNSERGSFVALERERRAALEKILTPAEMLDYDLRHSLTAANLRTDLALFRPSEQEFRALFAVQRAFDERWNPTGNLLDLPFEREMARREAYSELWKSYKAVIGAERFAHYERTRESGYQSTSLLVSRLQLPPETTEKIWILREEFQRQAGSVTDDRTLSAEQRTMQLSLLAAQAATRVAPLLGELRNVELYRQHGGDWMAALAPQPGKK